MTTQAIQRAGPNRIALDLWGAERLQVLKEQIAPGASDAELDLFATVCKRTGLDPFAKQIWSIQRRQQVDGQWQTRQVIQIGVHGLRLIAARTREYQGQVGPFWCGEDEVWKDVWLAERPPKAARVGVRRKGFVEPVWSVAVWDRAVQKNRDSKPQALWATSGPEQLARTAERDALRRAFPLETADVEAVVDDEQVASNAAAYTRIFGTDEQWDQEGIPPARAVQHAGRTVDVQSGEVLDESDQQSFTPTRERDVEDQPRPTEPAFYCVKCAKPIIDQTGKPINDNQRDLLLQRFGQLLCRACREV